MSKTKVLKQKQEISENIEEPEETPQPAPKAKKQLTQEQLDNLAKAREKARERKIELGQISSKAKALKEEKLRKDADEYDKLISQKAKPEPPQKEEVIEPKIEPKAVEPKKKRIVKKYVYEEDDEDEEVEEVVIRKPKPKTKPEPSYNELIYESAQDRIKTKISEERTKSLINSLMPVHFR
jgi:hypothetical protein